MQRAYCDDDLPALQAALADWITQSGSCGYGHIGDLPHRIYAELRGRHPIGALVQIWEAAGTISGVAICFRFEAAFDLLVAPILRGSTVELAMLETATSITHQHMQMIGRAGDPVLSDVYRCDIQRQALLAQLGFAEYRMWDEIAERSLAEAIPAVHLAHGFQIRAATFHDAAGLADARNDAFGDNWTSTQYHQQVMAKPGYHPDHECVVVAPDGQIAAFCVYWLDHHNQIAKIEPVGTRAAFRRMGLGRAMLTSVLQQLGLAGMHTAVIEYDATNLPARSLYHSLGFQVRYETLGYRRSPDQGATTLGSGQATHTDEA
jgi:ribosomal protein S18 acetylase RimI-like enzyme